MPIYEYECKKCGYVTSFMEKAQDGRVTTKMAAAQLHNKNFAKKAQFYMFVMPQSLSNFFKRKCEKCGSRKLSKVLSIFTPNAVKSNADTMNDLSKMGNINFVPQSSGMGGNHGPPPGGCPYHNSTESQSDD